MKFPYDYQAAGRLLSDASTKATVLHVIALTAYGAEWLYGRGSVPGDPDSMLDPIEPAVLWNQLEEDFRVTIPPENENKLNALMLAVQSDGFYEDVDVFVSVCNALDDGELGDLVNGMLEEVSVPELLWACYEVLINRGADDIDFSPAILQLIDDIVSDEAEELDEDNNSVEGVLPYYERYMNEEKDALIQQLTQLGVSQDHLKFLRSLDPTAPARDIPVFDQVDDEE